MEFTLDRSLNAAANLRAGSTEGTETASLRALFHDMTNQLVTFSCMLEAVDADAGMAAGTRAQVTTMRAQTSRMLAVLRDSVDPHMRPAMVEVRGLVREVAVVANTRRLATVTAHSDGERWLRTHPAALWRVLANVVDNAVRAAGADGHVSVTVRDEPLATLVEVVDDGPGFGNAASGTASLGLHIAANLVERCCGNIAVLPADPHGVRVVLEFPDLTADQRGGRI